MDPLSVVGAFIAVLQISGTIISHCYDYRKGLRSAPRDLARVLDEVSDLRNVVERLIRLIDDEIASGRNYLPSVEQMTRKNGPLERCQSDLDSINASLETPLSEWKALGNRLVWPLKEKGLMKSLETIKRTKGLIDSTIIEDLIRIRNGSDNAAVAYYYFDFANKLQGTMEAMLRSLSSQLLTQAQDMPNDMGSLAQRHFNITRYGAFLRRALTTGPKPADVSQPSLSELVDVFRGIIEEFNDTYLIIDAPDESVELDMLLDFLETIVSWKSESLHLLVTSQSKREIEEVLCPIVDSQLLIKSTFMDEDILSFVESTLDGDRRLRKWSQEIKDGIKTTLYEGSQGMFQWVAFQLQALKECLTLRDVKQTLKTLPKTLNATYTRVMENMNQNYYKRAMVVLKLLALSCHPVQVQEASEFVAFDFDTKDDLRFDYELRLPEVERIFDICSGLVSMNTIVLTHADGSIKETIRELHLAHFSVKEFLLSYHFTPNPSTLLGPKASEDWNALFV
ncbi:MAG: hypothetical protein Q9191_001649 [Dirinaria sp. TL-2023a]